jgi:hypothetical protein
MASAMNSPDKKTIPTGYDRWGSTRTGYNAQGDFVTYGGQESWARHHEKGDQPMTYWFTGEEEHSNLGFTTSTLGLYTRAGSWSLPASLRFSEHVFTISAN